MSEQIKHECGIAHIRLLKPFEYYNTKYGTPFWGLNKLYLLMEKQHNRGQDGAGIVGVKLDVPPGKKFINRVRSNSNTPIKDCFVPIFDTLSKLHQNDEMKLFDTEWLKNNIDFASELLLGHLRYNTSGKSDISNVHPFIRNNNWKTRNLVLAGNFNMTNLDELFQKLIDIGQHPVETSDAITILEKIGSFLDEEVEKVYRKHKSKDVSKHDATQIIEENLDILDILKRSAKYWDGGYVIAGMLGHGDSFVMRDPKGIRPAYYYHDDEVIVVASERPAIQTAFNIPFDKVKELPEGNAIIIRKSGEFSVDEFIAPQVPEKCSFERIYFSRGTDLEIYKERRALGKHLVPEVLKSINYDFANTVFSYIPNTAIVAFLGMFDELRKYCNDVKRDMLLAAAGDLTTEKIDEILSLMPRIDQVAVKDTKLRTFISQGKQRDDLVAHVYDVTYGTIADDIDHLVVLDDSIVRGSTLKDSIIKMLSRLKPKKIIIASSAPQIRYPDCYGIDMTRMNEFIAFRATIQLLKDTKQTHIINDVYKKCKAQENLPKEQIINYVKEIYKPFSVEQISAKIAEMVTPKDCEIPVEIIYNGVEDLHKSCPHNLGDWYFTGDYPTYGGNKIVNQAFLNYIEGKTHRTRL
ncbi:MAG: class II glutamine amidotransferase [Bacteroidales bacterium]|jgi:amidophosphoribosyltransferase|nr:amidophosphoribosyltransferase [Bacteroidales bacterium]